MRLRWGLRVKLLSECQSALRVLLRNLLDNASRYAGDGARIAVSVAVVRGWVQLTVQDSGPGLSPAEMARLGERFFQIGRAHV